MYTGSSREWTLSDSQHSRTWKKTDCALQITWFSGELLEMLFCMKNICSQIPTIARTQHPLSYLGDSFSVFVYTGFRNCATILTLLCNSSCSGHVIPAQIWMDRLYFRTEKIRRTGQIYFICIFGGRIFVVYVEAFIGSCCFIQSCPKFVSLFRGTKAFVWKGLYSALLCVALTPVQSNTWYV